MLVKFNFWIRFLCSMRIYPIHFFPVNLFVILYKIHLIWYVIFFMSIYSTNPLDVCWLGFKKIILFTDFLLIFIFFVFFLLFLSSKFLPYDFKVFMDVIIVLIGLLNICSRTELVSLFSHDIFLPSLSLFFAFCLPGIFLIISVSCTTHGLNPPPYFSVTFCFVHSSCTMRKILIW